MSDALSVYLRRMSAWLFLWMWWVINTVSSGRAPAGCPWTAWCIHLHLHRVKHRATFDLTCMPASLQAITAAFVVTGLITFRNIHVVGPLCHTMLKLDILDVP